MAHTISPSVDVSKIDAACDKGVFEISLPKMPESKPKKIEVVAKKGGREAKGNCGWLAPT